MNHNNHQTVELLAPAGNFEKLEIAVHYGADAVYLAGQDFSLRNFSGNFSIEELHKAVAYAHAHGVKVYITCNIYSRNFEQEGLEKYLETIGEIGPDAIIVADPGIFMLARKIIPQIEIHVSTQSNTTNYNCALFWEQLGARRINTARELSLEEIRTITRKCDIEVESFIHGAMCISHSGRCLLSNFLAKRDSNRGRCNHPCRWEYAVVEAKRPGEYHPIQEDRFGTYIFNSKDLCLINHIPELIDAGISSLKIEGRMKGINYLASTVKVYREAIDTYLANRDTYRTREDWVEELESLSHRLYCTGFYFGDPDQTVPNYFDQKPGTVKLFVGKVLEKIGDRKYLTGVRNKIITGSRIEVVTRTGPARPDAVLSMTDREGKPVGDANPNDTVILELNGDYSKNDLIRMD